MVALVLLLIGFARAVRDTVREDADVRGPLYLTAVLLAGGALFYWQVEEWSLFDAFHSCVVTLATVGYGDFTPHTTVGKLFTIVYIVFGIGILFGFINKIARITTIYDYPMMVYQWNCHRAS